MKNGVPLLRSRPYTLYIYVTFKRTITPPTGIVPSETKEGYSGNTEKPQQDKFHVYATTSMVPLRL